MQPLQTIKMRATQIMNNSDSTSVSDGNTYPVRGHKSTLTIATVLDLPQLYQKPSAESLLGTLKLLRTAPVNWEEEQPGQSKVTLNMEGIPRYLTSIIASPLSWIDSPELTDQIREVASQCLSERSGRSATGAIEREFTIPLAPTTYGPSPDRHFTLKLYEPSLVSDNIGHKTWGSSYVLAKRLKSLPIPIISDADGDGPFILELGAGTGLLGLAAAAVWNALVVLTDLPSILPNLSRNMSANAAALSFAAPSAGAACGELDWASPSKLSIAQWQDAGTISRLQKRENDRFGIILAADPVYSPEHPELLTVTVKRWLLHAQTSRFILVHPLRELYALEFGDLKARLHNIELKILDEGQELGRDDWKEEVLHSWSVWGWRTEPEQRA